MAATELAVLVQPRAGRSEVVGRHGEAVKIRLAAPPVENAANEELVRFLADALRVPRAAVRVTRGARSRRKIVTIDGVAPAAVAHLLAGTT